MKEKYHTRIEKPIVLYNSRTRHKEDFVPIDAGKIGLYVCGPTVYDAPHIGNARPVVVFDLLFRLLRFAYGENSVTYVRNITDVDDKINQRASRHDITIGELTEKTIQQFHRDMEALGNLPVTIEPRATEHIDIMIDMIKILLQKDYAYQAEGNVLFAVEKYPDYGQLSRRSTKEMLAGNRIEIAPYKRNPMDFILWKKSSKNEPAWPSPWSEGRPGWHIECSAMAKRYLGNSFDIHAGGIDLIFPHHENEIAQSCCVSNSKTLANFWLHNGHLALEGEKMSKSLGNVLLVNELLKKYSGDTIRLALIMTHYRQPIDFSTNLLQQAQNILLKWKRNLPAQEPHQDDVKKAQKEIFEVLANDLNTPSLITMWHEWANQAQKQNIKSAKLKAALQNLGFLKQQNKTQNKIQKQQIEELLQKRKLAREKKDFQKSDEIRSLLLQNDIIIKDTKNGTEWMYRDSD